MKSIAKYCLLLLMTGLIAGCAESPSSSNSVIETSSSVSSSSTMEPGVSAEEYSAKANSINKVEYKTATITYSIREKTTGVYPINKADGNPMEPDAEITSSLVIQDKGGGFYTVSGGASSEFGNAKGGVNLYITGWFAWMKQLKRNSEVENSNVTFEGRYYLNPLGAWYKNTGTRPGLANASYEGEYFGSEEYFMHYGENGYCTNFTYRLNISNVGTITRFSSQKTEYNGTYSCIAEATVEYTF